ncbi:HlyD family secretion protein [Phenylobacterium montanum]|uniref:HlyD family efflux transporter periplasmic adaptor subunit n=1 Tax=Phenylobacterium montanum TaxID=2823693 RepID=A0A975IUR5_9CAUL|nr:HlyD family efflux transporter periplasmic adaptor subunit [Caulobacter sp. S6]QUD88020.1 HlyD family efflux transporter periplasmic adaptor subunit [Caulobacter sp. S6]
MADSAAARLQTPPVAEAPSTAATRDPKARRAQLFGLLGGAVVLAALGAGGYWLLIGSRHEVTDNAYVGADSATLTPQIAAQVVKVNVIDTQPVKQGDVLVQLDDTDQKITLAQAQAQLGQAERKVQGYFANEGALSGQIAARDAEVVSADSRIVAAQSDLDRARTEYGRREKLASSGAVSGDELTQAENAFKTAEAALAQARAAKAQAVANRIAAGGARDINTALISGVSADQNPEVAAARARVAAAQLDLDRTVLRAPIDGVIAKKNVAVGQRVAVGANLLTVVPITQSYVDANFKEVQLRKMKVGQPVTLTSDYYGSGVKFHGKVVGLGGGTGAAFSLIPAQNATGNWIKVVQRLPVRIAIAPEDMKEHPLRVGLSMTADVDVSQ